MFTLLARGQTIRGYWKPDTNRDIDIVLYNWKPKNSRMNGYSSIYPNAWLKPIYLRLRPFQVKIKVSGPGILRCKCFGCKEF